MPAETPPSMDFTQLARELPASRRFKSEKPIVFRVHGLDIFVSSSYTHGGVTIATWHPGMSDEGYALNVEPIPSRLPITADTVLRVRNYNDGAFSSGVLPYGAIGGIGLYDTITSLLNAPVRLRSYAAAAFKNAEATPVQILEKMHRYG